MKRISFLIILAFIASCAKIVPPTGGPKDVTPPKVIKTIPRNLSKDISPNEIEIKFDEYIVLKEINKNLIVSPPLNHKPTVKVYNKKIILKLNDTLKANTTYIINFGNSIADFTEGNVLSNYKYVFSTGKFLDSLKVSGYVTDAYTNAPEQDIYVMLYDTTCDSCLFNEIPQYITKTDKSGFFELTNIKTGTYKLFCLKDKNNNMKYDLPDEKIGFYEKYVIPYVKTTNDTLQKYLYGPDSIKLYSFDEKYKLDAFIEKAKRLNAATLQIVFSKPPDNKPKITFFNFDSISTIIKEFSEKNDTINIWMTDTTYWKKDTIAAVINYTTNKVKKTDTLFFKWFRKKINTQPVKLSLKYNPLPPFKLLTVESNEPFTTIDTAKIKLYKAKDTTHIPLNYNINAEKRYLEINFDKKEEEVYKIVFDSCAVKGVFQNCNDSTNFTFKIQKQDYYGTLIIKINNKPNHNIVLVLTDEKHKKIYRKQILKNKDTTIFKNLSPKTYSLQIIFDRNNDKEWTSGNLIEHIQPEKVKYINNIKIKSLWENKIEINLKDD